MRLISIFLIPGFRLLRVFFSEYCSAKEKKGSECIHLKMESTERQKRIERRKKN